MIDSFKIENLIHSCDEAFITAHKNLDLDALGSILAMYYVSNNLGKNAHIILDEEELNSEVKRAIASIKKVDNIIPEKYEDIENKITDKSLLIVTDTSKKCRVQNEKLLNINNKIVIDHHVESDDIIDNLSTTILDLISCTILIKVLQITTPKNSKFLYDPTKNINKYIIPKNRIYKTEFS